MPPKLPDTTAYPERLSTNGFPNLIGIICTASTNWKINPKPPRECDKEKSPPLQEQRIIKLRKEHIRWGKEKLAIVYERISRKDIRLENPESD